MKVIIIPSWYPTELNQISGVFFQEQANALKKFGNDVVVAYPEIRSLRNFNQLKTKSGYYFKVEKGIETYRYKGYNFLPRIKGYIQKKHLKMLLKLFDQIIKEQGKPDILHAHSIIWGGWSAAQISKIYEIPLVITEHSSAFTRNLFSKSQKKYIIEALEIANEIVAVSPSLKSELEKYTKKEIKLIPNIVNTTIFNSTKLESKNGKFRFFSLAFLTENKGMDILLRSFAKAFHDVDNVELVIGGDGQEKTNLEILSKELAINEKVIFIGRLTREQVVLEMQKCDSFVLASRSETFGVVYIEALASGRPVIATKCGGPNFIVNKKNGLLVETDDVAGLAEAMQNIITNFNKYNSQEIVEDCKKRFSEESVCKELNEIYTSLVMR